MKDRLSHDRDHALEWNKMEGRQDWMPAIPFTEGLRQTVEWYRVHPTGWQEILSGKYQAYYQRHYGARVK